jgi:hypothetical protein
MFVTLIAKVASSLFVLNGYSMLIYFTRGRLYRMTSQRFHNFQVALSSSADLFVKVRNIIIAPRVRQGR